LVDAEETGVGDEVEGMGVGAGFGGVGEGAGGIVNGSRGGGDGRDDEIEGPRGDVGTETIRGGSAHISSMTGTWMPADEETSREKYDSMGRANF
jgi:hypothetical protein